jgi:hypothetical protein
MMIDMDMILPLLSTYLGRGVQAIRMWTDGRGTAGLIITSSPKISGRFRLYINQIVTMCHQSLPL